MGFIAVKVQRDFLYNPRIEVIKARNLFLTDQKSGAKTGWQKKKRSNPISFLIGDGKVNIGVDDSGE